MAVAWLAGCVQLHNVAYAVLLAAVAAVVEVEISWSAHIAKVAGAGAGAGAVAGVVAVEAAVTVAQMCALAGSAATLVQNT